MHKNSYYILIFLVALCSACSLFKKKKGVEFQSNENITQGGQVSAVSGIPYNDSSNVNSFHLAQFNGQIAGPNLVFIEGGSFVMGMLEEDMFNLTKSDITRVYVPSFYMDRTEVANLHWLEYMAFYEKDQSDIPSHMSLEEYQKLVLMPDTTVWASESSFNDSYVHNYLRHPGFRMYPVVGVSWLQAQDFCKWRTKMVNEVLQNKDRYTGVYRNNKIDVGTMIKAEQKEVVQLPDYRLPNEAEWEYAAKANAATQYDDSRDKKPRIYPWDGRYLRNPYKKNMGQFMANFKRGRGDYAGVAGRQNDGAMLTEWIYAYPPNDFGLYNMAGNVNEWVDEAYFIDDEKFAIRKDEYQSFKDFEDYRLLKRASIFSDSTFESKMNPHILLYDPRAAQIDTSIVIKDAGSVNRDNFVTFPNTLVGRILEQDEESKSRYRVYKGGSWKDVAYWLSPGTRRFMEENRSSATIGFRCAMSYVSGDIKKEEDKKSKKKK
jgi:gliding motility-associated lipoprotein GldJ